MIFLKCSKCGSKLPEGSRFRLKCGSKLEENKSIDELEINKEIILDEVNENE